VWFGCPRYPLTPVVPMLRDDFACIDIVRLIFLMPYCLLSPATRVWFLLSQDALWLALFWTGMCRSLADALCMRITGGTCGSIWSGQDFVWLILMPYGPLIPQWMPCILIPSTSAPSA
jgi:hypothetical protein